MMITHAPPDRQDPPAWCSLRLEAQRRGISARSLRALCKRLNVKGASLAREYVREGMMRFVTGKYSPELPIGGMIGYVMDGNVEAASRSVIEQIVSGSNELRCTEDSVIFLARPDHFSTVHARNPITIELRHQLLSAI